MTATAPATRSRYHPALDGLRGLAVIGVVLYHAGVSWVPGGFLGVTVFFVLSGYLITSLLLAEGARTGAVSLRRFWARRARRLLPGLLVVVVAIGLWWRYVDPADVVPTFRADGLATLLYVANWHAIAAQSDYFSRTGAPSPFLHTWSLAIEEQFYVLWAVIVWLVVRSGAPRVHARRVVVVAAALVAGSAVEMAALHVGGISASRLYYGTDTEAQAPLAGALLAAVVAARRRTARARHVASRPSRLAPAVGAVALAGLVAASARTSGTAGWLYDGGFLAVSAATAAVVHAVVARPDSLLARALAVAPLRGLGRISYGVYLWHWPLDLALTNARTGLAGTPLLVLRLVVTVAAALLSHVLVEQPVRRGALRTAAARLATPVAVGAGLVAVLAVPLPGIIESSPADASPVPPTHPATRSAPTTGRGAGAPGSGAAGGVPATVPLRPPPPAGAPVVVSVLGDSVAETLALGMEGSVATAQGVTLHDDGVLGCGVATSSPYRYFGTVSAELPQCLDWPAVWTADLQRDQPEVALVVLGRWEVMDREYEGQWTQLGAPAFDAYVESGLEQAVDTVLATGARVALCTAPYYFRGETPSGGRFPEDDPARVDVFNGLVRQVAARHPGTVAVIDLGGHTSVGGVYTPVVDGIRMRYDGVHFTPDADRWLAPWLLPQIAALARRTTP